MLRFVAIFCALGLLPSSALAKRGPPPKVEPVVYQGVRFTAPNDDGRRGYIEAWDVQSNKKLWELTIFRNNIDPELEEDVQHTFIKKLSVSDGKLIVDAEKERAYSVDLHTGAVTEIETSWLLIFAISTCGIVGFGLLIWLFWPRKSNE